MKLFYSTGTSSMSCVIAVEELGVKCELIEVSWSKNQNVSELEQINPLGTVPTLVLDDGHTLTQNTAVLEYLAESVARNSSFLPPVGTFERLDVIRWLAFVAADFHKAFTVSFRAEDMASDAVSQGQIEQFAKGNIKSYLKHLEFSLTGKTFITGVQFTIADCYLTVILGWCEWLEIDLAEYPSVKKYLDRATQRPGVSRALGLEAH